MPEDRMNPTEAVALCRFAKAACPQQAFDEYTPDAWGELLRDLRFVDCKEALTNVARRQPFVSPAEIRVEVKRIRYDRISTYGPYEIPSGLSWDEYQQFERAIIRAIADGDLTRENTTPLAGEPREIPELDGVFRYVE